MAPLSYILCAADALNSFTFIPATERSLLHAVLIMDSLHALYAIETSGLEFVLEEGVLFSPAHDRALRFLEYRQVLRRLNGRLVVTDDVGNPCLELLTQARLRRCAQDLAGSLRGVSADSLEKLSLLVYSKTALRQGQHLSRTRIAQHTNPTSPHIREQSFIEKTLSARDTDSGTEPSNTAVTYLRFLSSRAGLVPGD